MNKIALGSNLKMKTLKKFKEWQSFIQIKIVSPAEECKFCISVRKPKNYSRNFYKK